ncbi:MAG TPA: hypothetical protein VFF48_10875 [Brevundimonas sp.]|nr:hypothetical protein [Brevundimonas sp.]
MRGDDARGHRLTALVALVAGDRAILAADQGVWGPDGRIQSFESKLHHVEAARSVVAAQGVFSQAHFRAVVQTAEGLKHLHALIVQFMTRNVAWAEGDKLWPGNEGLMRVAGASWFAGSPVIWGIGQDLSAASLEPMNLGTLWVSPNVDWSAAIGQPIHGREAAATLGPVDALAIMEAQRRVLDQPKGSALPISLAGGGCDVAVVDASGVSIDTLKIWPDVIGERISA